MQTLILAASACEEPLPENCFSIPSPPNPLFEFDAFLFEGNDWIALNRTGLLFLISAAIVFAIMWMAFGNAKVVPGRMQAAIEAIISFLRDQVVIPAAGQGGVRYLPLLTAMFFFIWINNLFEVMPLVNFPTTSRMAMPMALALMVWTIFILVGIKAQGVKYFTGVLFPPGLPIGLYLLVTPIELVSTFVVRPLTLAVRLFANMVAGHILLTVCFIAANAFLIGFTGGATELFSNIIAPSNPLAILVGLVGLAGGAALVGFEIMVASLQAYIFTMLTAVYIGTSLSEEH